MRGKLTPVQEAELEHENLEDRSVEAWQHPRNCTYCLDQRVREIEDGKDYTSSHGQQKEA